MLMASLEPTDITVIRCGMELLKMEAWGMPVEAILNLILLIWITLSGGLRAYKAARYTAGLASRVFCHIFFRQTASAEEQATDLPDKDCAPASGPFIEACMSLQCKRPTYDPKARLLTCDGLLVTFVADEGPHVKSVLACPEAGQDGVCKGIELNALLSPEEFRLLVSHAEDLRHEVIRRDREEASARAAAQMRRRRMERELQASHMRLYGGPDDGCVVVDAEWSPDAEQLLDDMMARNQVGPASQPAKFDSPPVQRSRQVPIIKPQKTK